MTLTKLTNWGDNVANVIFKDGIFILIAMFFTSEKNVLKCWPNFTINQQQWQTEPATFN